MKYYLVGKGNGSNLVRWDEGGRWHVLDERGDWVDLTPAVERYRADQNIMREVSAAEAELQYRQWFPRGAGLEAPARA